MCRGSLLILWLLSCSSTLIFVPVTSSHDLQFAQIDSYFSTPLGANCCEKKRGAKWLWTLRSWQCTVLTDKITITDCLFLGYPCKTSFDHLQLVVVHNFQSTLWLTVMFNLKCFGRGIENHAAQMWLLRKKYKAIFEIWDPCVWVRRWNSKVYFSLIFVNDNLCLRQQCAPTSWKARGILGCIKRSVTSSSREVILSLHCVLLRSHLECHIHFWGPQHGKDMDLF